MLDMMMNVEDEMDLVEMLELEMEMDEGSGMRYMLRDEYDELLKKSDAWTRKEIEKATKVKASKENGKEYETIMIPEAELQKLESQIAMSEEEVNRTIEYFLTGKQDYWTVVEIKKLMNESPHDLQKKMVFVDKKKWQMILCDASMADDTVFKVEEDPFANHIDIADMAMCDCREYGNRLIQQQPPLSNEQYIALYLQKLEEYQRSGTLNISICLYLYESFIKRIHSEF